MTLRGDGDAKHINAVDIAHPKGSLQFASYWNDPLGASGYTARLRGVARLVSHFPGGKGREFDLAPRPKVVRKPVVRSRTPATFLMRILVSNDDGYLAPRGSQRLPMRCARW